MGRLLTLAALAVTALNAVALSQYSMPANGFGALLYGLETVDGVDVNASD